MRESIGSLIPGSSQTGKKKCVKFSCTKTVFMDIDVI